MKKSLILAGVLSFLLVACDSPKRVEELSFSPTETTIVKQQNAFAVNLLRQVTNDGEDNVFVSPLSAGIACAMLSDGANGETRQQLMDMLAPEGTDPADLNLFYQQLIKKLPRLDKTTKVSIANAVWADDELPVLDSYVASLKMYYLAETKNIDLSDGKAADVINAWAKKQTGGRIDKICDPSQFNGNVKMVLADALSFKGQWDKKFKEKATQEQTFYLANGSTKKVQMMRQREDFRVTRSIALLRDPEMMYGESYYEVAPTEEELPVRMLSMSYKDRKYRMDVILPDEGVSLDAVLKALSSERLDKLSSYQKLLELEVGFPRMEMRYHRSMIPDLEQLGVTDAFNPDRADFSGITKAESLYASAVYQDTYLKIDEEGTEARAVTHVIIAPSSPGPMEATDPFIVDRPCLLLIREAKTGLILFAGKMGNPEE